MTKKGPDGKDEKRYMAALRYSGMAIQFGVMIAIAAWGGQWLDEYFNTPKPFITIFLILFFTVGYFIKMYYDLMR